MTSIKTDKEQSSIKVNPAGWNEISENILTPELLALLNQLHNELNDERLLLLNKRKQRQQTFDRGQVPQYYRNGSTATTTEWKINPLPQDLLCRRVEITGPVNSAKMVINMLSRNENGSRADAAMLDFEDSMNPTWDNVINGYKNLVEACDGSLQYIKKNKNGSIDKIYKLNPNDMPLIMVRCRGLHLNESNVTIDGVPISGGLLDLAVSFFHTAKKLMAQGKTPKYYVPKCEHYLEARWWNKLFSALEDALKITRGTLKATFLIETLPAAYQMEEILYEFREHAAGLNGGRWDKIFSDIKVLKYHPDKIMADRGTIDMKKHWMDNYVKRIIKVCHSHGAFAMGGMSAFTPGKDAETRKVQTDKVIADKSYEAFIGHDGCWVSHPYFIEYAMKSFSKKNQLDVLLEEFDKYPDLLPVGETPRTIAGLRTNIRVGIAYMQGWNSGSGCVSWDNLMEDLATLEISRAQVWQWLFHQVKTDDGVKVTCKLVSKIFTEELDIIIEEVRDNMASADEEDINTVVSSFEQAKKDAENIFLSKHFNEFLFTQNELV